MKKVILIGVVIALLVAFGVYMYVFHKPARTADSEDAVYSISDVELIAAFENDENDANSKYLDKIIQVSGTVTSVSESENEVSVNLKESDGTAGVTCSFDKNTIDKSKVRPGDKVFIKGICSGYLMDVVLNRCVLDTGAPK